MTFKTKNKTPKFQVGDMVRVISLEDLRKLKMPKNAPIYYGVSSKTEKYCNQQYKIIKTEFLDTKYIFNYYLEDVKDCHFAEETLILCEEITNSINPKFQLRDDVVRKYNPSFIDEICHIEYRDGEILYCTFDGMGLIDEDDLEFYSRKKRRSKNV